MTTMLNCRHSLARKKMDHAHLETLGRGRRSRLPGRDMNMTQGHGHAMRALATRTCGWIRTMSSTGR